MAKIEVLLTNDGFKEKVGEREFDSEKTTAWTEFMDILKDYFPQNDDELKIKITQ